MMLMYSNIKIVNAWTSSSKDTDQVTTINQLKCRLGREWRDRPDGTNIPDSLQTRQTELRQE